jgi:hypothetical protein
MTDSPTFEFRSDDNRDLVVLLTATPPDADGFGGFKIVIEAEGVRAERRVLTYRGDGLDTFFENLAADCKGSDGTRSWDAVEHGMTIEASHRGSRVDLVFILRRDYDPDAWELRIPVRVAPGETLQRLAEATATAVAVVAHR